MMNHHNPFSVSVGVEGGTVSSNHPRGRTPSPASNSNNHTTITMEVDHDSPLPPGQEEASSQSSPGSASDHMGQLLQPMETTSTATAVVYPFATNTNHTTTTTSSTTSTTQQPDPSLQSQPQPDRRQKRLERNRQSARLSRRRRKHYLEVLQTKVQNYGATLDSMRRQYVNQSMDGIIAKNTKKNHNQQAEALPMPRTHPELLLCTTFQYQQLPSFCGIATHEVFILWLTLQNEPYFRGGRASSERLSAARIGERILSGGTDHARPDQNMWPLLCNEMNLSYDQEEKVRTFQRTILTTPHTWLDRHQCYATKQVILHLHETVQSVSNKLHTRERSAHATLSAAQKLALQHFATGHRGRLSKATNQLLRPPVVPTTRANTTTSTIAPHNESTTTLHQAAHQYLINDTLKGLLQTLPRAAPLLTGKRLKKLSRRPSFESLGHMDVDHGAVSRSSNNKKPLAKATSSGSLKRNLSEMSMDNDNESTSKHNAPPQLAPVDAQRACANFVMQHLSVVAHLLPSPVPHQTTTTTSVVPSPLLLPPQPTTAASNNTNNAAYYQNATNAASMPLLTTNNNHHRKSSFLPDHLNVVVEELWPDDTADILLDMMSDNDDWAIGEGIDMEEPTNLLSSPMV